jgi:hypothetical protein
MSGTLVNGHLNSNRNKKRMPTGDRVPQTAWRAFRMAALTETER